MTDDDDDIKREIKYMFIRTNMLIRKFKKCSVAVKTRKSCTGQVLPSAKYQPTRVVVDAALRRIGKSRHRGHKIANISVNCQRI